jgi:hypothetical protein
MESQNHTGCSDLQEIIPCKKKQESSLNIENNSNESQINQPMWTRDKHNDEQHIPQEWAAPIQSAL